MTFVRSIGRWAMTGLVINGIIGSGIFGVPGELTHLLGRASPLAMVFAALGMAIIMAVITEVASQFSDPGGPYLYVRTAFGRFFGLQIGWFWLLAIIGGAAANANLFVIYLAGFLPPVGHGWGRALAITALITVPTIANHWGARSGANLSNLLTVAKLLPLCLLIVLGVFRFGSHLQTILPSEIIHPGWGAWLSALLLLLFVYGGYEDSLAPMGEVKEPKRTVPFALATGLLVCAATYSLLQFVTVATIGTMATDRPLVGVGNGVDRSRWRRGGRSCGDDLELRMDRRIHLECAANSVRFFGPRRFSPLPQSIAFTISNAGARDLHLLCSSLGTRSDWNVPLGRGGLSGVDGDRVWRHMRCADPAAKNAATRPGSPPAVWLRICPGWNRDLYGITQSLEYS